MRPAGGYTPDMYNYAYETDVYKIWADMICFDYSTKPLGTHRFCAFVGRRDGKTYKMDHNAIMAKYGHCMKMEGRIPDDESTRRITKLIAEVEASTAKAHQSMLGMNEMVLVEGLSKRDPGMVSGKGTRSITVTFKGTEADIGRIVPVHITSAAVNTLRGERTER